MSEQLDLIEPAAPTRKKRLAAAREAADAGIARVAEATEREHPEWCELACEELRKFAAHQGGVFIIEMARAVVEKNLPPTKRARVWGAVTRMAKKRGFIEPTDKYFPAASSNGSPKPVYRKGPKA